MAGLAEGTGERATKEAEEAEEAADELYLWTDRIYGLTVEGPDRVELGATLDFCRFAWFRAVGLTLGMILASLWEAPHL